LKQNKENEMEEQGRC